MIKKYAFFFGIAFSFSIVQPVFAQWLTVYGEEQSVVGFEEKVERDGDRLLLKLEDGEDIIFENKTDGIATYIFRNYLKDIGFYLLEVRGSDSGWALLVSGKSGASYLLAGPPIISDDRKRIAAWNEDVLLGIRKNKLEIYRIKSDKLVQEYSEEYKAWGPKNAVWNGSEEIQFFKITPEDFTGVKKRLVKSAFGWKLKD